METYYEYDEEREVLIKISPEELIKIFYRSEGRWRDINYRDDSYLRAIFLGQGCWERLDTITLEKGQRILKEWGFDVSAEAEPQKDLQALENVKSAESQKDLQVLEYLRPFLSKIKEVERILKEWGSTGSSLNAVEKANASEDVSAKAKLQKDLQVLENLRSFLPKDESLENVKSFLKDESIYVIEVIGEGEIAYTLKRREDESDEERNERLKELFAISYHPFIQRFTDRVAECTKSIQECIGDQPWWFQVSRDALHVCFERRYYSSELEETSEYIKYWNHYQDSIHDGGGGGSVVWCLYSVSVEDKKEQLSHESMDRIFIPPCKGYWIEEERMYLVDPWDIPGVFGYYYNKSEQWSYSSDETTWTVGKSPRSYVKKKNTKNC